MNFIPIMLRTLGTVSPLARVSASELPDPLEAGWKGKAVCELLEEDELQRVIRCTFRPGEGHERHYHPPHAGYTLASGTMRIRDDEGTRIVEPANGHAWTSNGTSWHEVENIGETTAVFLLFEPKPSGIAPGTRD